MEVKLKDSVPVRGQSESAGAVGDGGSYISDGGEEVIRIPIYSDADREAIEEWLKNDLYADDYYEAVYGDFYNAPIDVVSEPMSRFDKYVGIE
jgi:hypothetical protein